MPLAPGRGAAGQGAAAGRRALPAEHAAAVGLLRSPEAEAEYYGAAAHMLFHYHAMMEGGGGGKQRQDAGGAAGALDGGRGAEEPRRQCSILEFMTRGAGGSARPPDPPGGEACRDAARDPAGGETREASRYSVMTKAELSEMLSRTAEAFTRCCSQGEARQAPAPPQQARRAPRPSGPGGQGGPAGGRSAPRPPSLSSKACPHCGSGGRALVSSEGYLLCPDCDAVEYVMIDSERPSYREAPREISYFCYKRQNHFQEWISQTQGREYTNIPDSVFDMILVELKKQKVTNVATLTQRKLKEVMRKLGLNKYYEHLQFLLNHLSGAPLARIPPELEAQLRRMFQQVQVPFMKHAPKSRRNFLSYSFCLHKMLQLLGHDEFLHHFPLLKSREKLHQQDVIWRAICEDLGWQWIRSV